MHWLIGIAAFVALAIALYVYLAITCFFTEVTFMTAYRVEYESSGSRDKALRAAMAVFQGRTPFSDLTEQDMARLIAVFALVPEPRTVAQIWRFYDRRRSVAQLRDPKLVDRLEEEYRRLSGA